MSFNPALPTLRDRIRIQVGDTNVASEIYPDATYDAAISQYSDWKLAMASMAEAVAVAIEQDVSSFSAGGDLSVSWSDRTRSLRALALRLRQEVANDSGTTLSGIVSIPMARDSSGSSLEYTQRYRRLVR